ncbi:hypothetical protein CCY99_09085 [Helicobacter sp. 16-1353]|uniref:ketoacyl-ACP synthase III n=1 Tax=Helicobacter sp. 16-1353 TaxID=2004996 RepID=UPI000DCCC821|nr:ketoacyl-ACP synthase III [Helicobacter sp. 16-1353]RAX51424.1 hypothetical protein CCY99_09085 [Helicobacter sp. 16-1353]
MPKIMFNNAKIAGIVACVPKDSISLDSQINIFYDNNTAKLNRIKKTIGLDKRHIADKNTTTLDLCLESARLLLEMLSLDRDKIDAVIFVTQTPDFLQPNNSHILHSHLNLKESCACFDVNQGCSGYVYGLYLAFMMIETNLDNILLCAGDTMSKVVNPSDSNTAPLFGDGGSATIITRKIAKSYFSLNANGNGYRNIILPNSGFRGNLSDINCEIDSKDSMDSADSKDSTKDIDSKYLYMNGGEVFNFSIDKEPKAIKEILGFGKYNINDIDLIFFHQANAYILTNIAKRLNIPLEKVPMESISKYGNTSSASIPLAICDYCTNKKIEKNLKVILSGFGVGLSWASALLELDSPMINIKFYQKETK